MITVLENLRIQQLKLDLDALRPNFSKNGESAVNTAVPNLEDVLHGNPEARQYLQKMIDGDSAQKLYGAIILHELDRTHSERILRELGEDDGTVKVRNKSGHGLVLCPVRRLAQAFLEAETIRTDYLEKLEKLADWRIAVEHEARTNYEIFHLNELPTLEDVYTLRERPAKAASFYAKIDKLTTQGAARKVYAAFLLKDFDDEKSREILETLRENWSPVLFKDGDLAINFAAREIAAEMLENRGIHQSFDSPLHPKNTKIRTNGFFQRIREFIFGR